MNGRIARTPHTSCTRAESTPPEEAQPPLPDLEGHYCPSVEGRVALLPLFRVLRGVVTRWELHLVLVQLGIENVVRLIGKITPLSGFSVGNETARPYSSQ
ncbi:unnamed protein product [Protopolystoma xenopodis]|uniref:Uncharacterized protein n=1 Tax=Protopolystoma xenopodis TaxID=117903 RepID=A0A448WDI6_9PLAT|nr:unnamed protein product [Protopolystoma xenopodis]